MGGTYWSLDECCWVGRSPDDGAALAAVEGDVTAIPRQPVEDVEAPAVST